MDKSRVTAAIFLAGAMLAAVASPVGASHVTSPTSAQKLGLVSLPASGTLADDEDGLFDREFREQALGLLNGFL